MINLSAVRNRNWEDQFRRWAQPPSKTEEEKCERAARAVKQAIDNSVKLSRHGVTTHVQGSFNNRVNVRQDSDVDLRAFCNQTIYVDYPPGVTDADAGLSSPADYRYSEFKNDVGDALVAHFGAPAVRRGNKAFDIHENSYRVDADVVATFEYRLYYHGGVGGLSYHKGTALITDLEGTRVTAFPEQQYQRGVTKNENTGRLYKPVVRIIKNLRNEMHDDARISEAGPMASFLIESCVWNIPDHKFNSPTFERIVASVLYEIYENTTTEHGCRHYLESNGIKLLFSPNQKWTREQVHFFARAALIYINSQ
jgi:hypothetical protein